MPLDLDAALAEANRLGASDLHVKVPSVPRLRVGGVLRPLALADPITPADTESLMLQVLQTDAKRAQLEARGAVEVSYYTAAARFRASVYRQRGSVSLIFRLITEAPPSEGLGIPDVVLDWAKAQQGLVIVGGPTGSGKSTTCAVVVRLINEQRACHIITIEDPIEFLHPDIEALVSQREIGVDAPNFHDALRSALRQDPDVILVGEVRDEETAMTALRAAETGHLVLSTIHTSGAAESIQRFVELFGERNEHVARELLASSLVGVVSQRLIPTADGEMALNPEILIATSRVQDMLRESAPASVLHESMVEGSYYGMRTFDQDLTEKVKDGVIDEKTALAYATNPQDFKLMLQGSLVSRAAAGEASLSFMHPEVEGTSPPGAVPGSPPDDR
ncbi:MAG: twitching motility protein PilT [Thermoleophilaceae bacterium]|nr:twitching motility protein PilT [Thermoleophilaceae bacterium]